MSAGSVAQARAAVGAHNAPNGATRAPMPSGAPTLAPGHHRHAPQPYLDAYRAGAGIGLVLLLAFVVMGRGLGASGAFSSAVAAAVQAAAPARAAASSAYAPYLADGGPLRDWLVFEMVGVAIGGFLSALLAGRLRAALERGPRAGARVRMGAGFAGGTLMGVGAKLARGCTSGQALTGGAMLSVGSWIFIGAAFAAGYVAAPLLRRLWT